MYQFHVPPFMHDYAVTYPVTSLEPKTPTPDSYSGVTIRLIHAHITLAYSYTSTSNNNVS